MRLGGIVGSCKRALVLEGGAYGWEEDDAMLAVVAELRLDPEVEKDGT